MVVVVPPTCCFFATLDWVGVNEKEMGVDMNGEGDVDWAGVVDARSFPVSSSVSVFKLFAVVMVRFSGTYIGSSFEMATPLVVILPPPVPTCSLHQMDYTYP